MSNRITYYYCEKAKGDWCESRSIEPEVCAEVM